MAAEPDCCACHHAEIIDKAGRSLRQLLMQKGPSVPPP